MEILSIKSFLAQGHPYHLYVYDEVGNVPEGVVLKDAHDILDREQARRDRFNSFGFCSDKFRYKLLLARGGWWVDTDIICVKPFEFPDPHCYAFEQMPNGRVCGAVLKAPVGSPLMAALDERATPVREHATWGDIGPMLVTNTLKDPAFAEYRRFIQPFQTFYPIGWVLWRNFYFTEYGEGHLPIPAQTHAIHLWRNHITSNLTDPEEQRAFFDPDRRFPETTIFGYYQKKYL